MAYGLTLSRRPFDAAKRRANQRKSELLNQYPLEWQKVHAEIARLRQSPGAGACRKIVGLETALDWHLRNLQSSQAYKDSSFQNYRWRTQIEDLFVQQVKEMAQPDNEEPMKPTIFFIGNECGKGHDGAREKGSGKVLLAAVQRKLTSQGYPVLFYLVDEAYSSQRCPDPTCLRPPGRYWWGKHADARKPVTQETMAGKEDFIRSR